jgi:hypothetical protein
LASKRISFDDFILESLKNTVLKVEEFFVSYLIEAGNSGLKL